MKNKNICHHPSYAWVILGLITGMHVMNIFSGRSIIPLTPLIQSDLNLSHFQIGIFTTIYFTGAFLSSFPMGWLVDKIGVYATMPIGQFIVGIFILSISMVNSFVLICTLLFLAGIGHAAINPATAKVVMAWFPLNRRATAMGIKQTGVPIGSALAAAMLPAIALLIGWRKAFILSGLVSITSVILSLIFYRKPTYGDKHSSATPLPDFRISVILKNRDIILLSVLMIGFLMLQSSLETYIVLYCKDVLNYTLITSGFLLSITQIGAISGRLCWGPVSDIFLQAKRKIVLMIIGGISSAMCLVFALLPPNSPILLIGVLVFIFGACAIGWNAIYLVFAAELAGRGREGRAIGISLTIAFIGHLIGPPLFGYMVDLSGSYSASWIIFCLIMAITTTLISLIHENQK